jgi:RNA polymerase sigma factor (sigma-70 family)
LRAAVEKRLRGQAFGPWDGSDVVQKLCVKLLLPDHALRGTTGQEFLAWMLTMTRNEILDALRAGKAQKRGGGQAVVSLGAGDDAPADTSSPSRQLMRREDHQQVQEALGRLSDDDRQVIGLRTSGLSWAEVADQMRRSEDAVKQLFRRAFKRLQGEMKGEP